MPPNQRPDLVVCEMSQGRSTTYHVDIGVITLRPTSRNPHTVIAGAEQRKRAQRGAVALQQGASFVPFIVSEQGAVGQEGEKFLQQIKKEMPAARYSWWRRRLVSQALKGSYAVAATYFSALSRKYAAQARVRWPVEVGQ